LAEEGAHVVVCARGEAALKKSADAIQKKASANARVLAVAADLSSEDGARRVIDGAIAQFGRLDVLINNIGTAKGADVEMTTDADWQEAIDQTLFPAIRMTRLAVPQLRKQGGGAIVIVSSIFGREAGGRMTYNAVKAAEISLTKSLAQQLAKDQIRVVSVAPGSILFEGGSWWKRQQSDPDGIAKFVRQELPFGRFGKPEEVGAAIAFVASPKASWISGTTVVVDGCQSRMF
jgi:3-oxoacyl-[acyl-carrier protein] reductase